MIIQRQQIEDVISDTFGRRFTRDFYLQLSDESYYCPAFNEVKLLIKKNTGDRLPYTDEIYDCDDYALALKYYFIKHAYKNSKRRVPYCVGIVMGGKLQGDIPHALNFVITNTLKLYLIEPQTDKISLPKSSDREIYFMYL